MTPSLLTNVIAQSGNGEILISWDFQVGSTGYTVQRSTDRITYSTLGTVTVPQYLDTTGTPGTQYWYRVAGVNGSGTGLYSNPVTEVPTLAGQMTLGQMRLLSQQKADRVNSTFVTKAEWNVYINQSYFELYDLLVQKYGNEYYVADPLLITTDGSDHYALPTGSNYNDARPIYKLLGVDMQIAAANDAWLTLKKYEFIQRNAYVYPQLTSNMFGAFAPRYRLQGGDIKFIPSPAGGQIIRLWYIPRMENLLLDTDIVDGVSGWTEYIAVDAAIKALQKEESDVTVLMMQKQALIQRIEAAAENRDAGEPEVISPTRRWSGWGDGGGSGDWGPSGGI
jgi:hypothetical protein